MLWHIFSWIVDLDGAPGTLYDEEHFQLQFKFGPRYPFDSPQVSLFSPTTQSDSDV